MFKSFRLTILSTLVLTAFTTQASFSVTKPLAQKTQSLKVIKPKVDVPICYMEAVNGSILNLSNLCKQKSTNSSTRLNPTSSNLYNDSLMKKSDDELYGKGN